MTSTKSWDYQPVEYKDQDIEINGYPMYAESLSGSEPYTRREWSEKSIMNGTILIGKGQFVPRQYSFKTVLFVTPEKVDVHDKILRDMVIEPAEIVCPAMGEPFQAMVTIKKDNEDAAPNHISLEFNIKEIPGPTSDITQSNIYEGTESSMTIEEYTEENQEIVTTSKGSVDTSQGEVNIETETSKISTGEISNNGTGGANTTKDQFTDLNINTKN